MQTKPSITIAALAALILSAIVNPATADPPPLPTRIAGTVTVDGMQLDQTTDTGYEFTVVALDGSEYTPDPTRSSGLNSHDWYIVDIPIKDSESQPDGAEEESQATIEVYKNGTKLSVASPTDGHITLGESGAFTRVDLKLTSATTPTSGTSAAPAACGAGAMISFMATIMGFTMFRLTSHKGK